MCGVIGAYSLKDKTKNVYPLIVRGLLDLQHRGQLSAGITSYNQNRKRILQTHKDNGKVHEVFQINHQYKSKKLNEDYGGHAAIGHARYATSGDNGDQLAQPFERPHGRKSKWFSLAFNGNLANYDKLKNGLEDVGYNMTYDSDTEVIMHFLSREVQAHKPWEELNFVEIFRNLLKDFDGSWNIAFLNADAKMVAVRDPLGLKPMCYGVTKDDVLVFASESVVLSNLQIEPIDLKPGEMIIVDEDGYRVVNYIDSKKTSYCFFEWIYFGHLASVMDGESVYHVRENIGKQLAIEETVKFNGDYIVVPVPESSYVAGAKYAQETHVPFVQGLLKNHSIGRTFIDNTNRTYNIQLKFTHLREVLRNKKVILIDDSIVRGTTMEALVKNLKEWSGVKEVHLRIGCPPITSPCFYGIDFPTIKELYTGFNKPNASDFGADSLQYLSLEGMTKALNKDDSELCMACLTSKYPTQEGTIRYKQQVT
jgi:amidophosphoribosyltransferase|tara:strand:- start:384 stop:1823 length:1440 start_codon:yes stop_codon:yes gene_type:complete